MGVVLVTSVLAACCAVLAAGLQCEAPLDPTVCSRLRMRCIDVGKEECAQAGGRFGERGSFCLYCNLCAVHVGEGARCNRSVEGTALRGSGAPLTAVCTPPLVCTRRHDGVCVPPEACAAADDADNDADAQ